MTGTKRRAQVKPAKILEFDKEDRRLFKALAPKDDEVFDEEIFSQHSTPSWPSSTSSDMTLIPSGTSTPLYGTTSFQILPHFYRLMTYYTIESASALYPLQSYLGFNPVQRFWFPMALTDEVLLHTIMYSAAVSLSKSQSGPAGRSASNDLIQLAAPILRLLTDRLSGQRTINDATIGAVSCLVMVENQADNREKSQVHLKGLQQMIQTRGGMETIDPGLVTKIARADVEGSVDNLSRPSLPRLKKSAPTLYTTLPAYAWDPPSETLLELLSTLEIRAQLSSTLLSLSNFTTAVQYYTSLSNHPISARIDPRSFDEDLLSITRDLLEIPPLSVVEEPLQISALIFAKSIGRGLPFASAGSQLLPKRLKQALSLLIAGGVVPFSKSVLLWLCFMGGVASRVGSCEETWFVDQLVGMTDELLQLQQWEGTKYVLKEILFVDVVHDEPCRKLWEQVEKMCDLKKRWDRQVEVPL